MKKRTRKVLGTLLIVPVWCWPAFAQTQKPRQAVIETEPVSMQRRTRQLRQLRIDMPEVLSVTVTADAALVDAVSYESGDTFVVIVPQANVASVRSNSRSRDLVDLQVEQRGEDVAVSLHLQSGAKARVSIRGNLLEVGITPADEVIAQASTSTGQPRIAASVNSNMASPSTSAPESTPTTPQLQPSPTGSPEVANILNRLFGIKADKATVDTSNVDLSVPESPAFTVLGLTPNTVVRPATPREFASSLLNGLDQNGNFQSGLALDTVPFLLFNGENVSLLDYNHNYLMRLLSRSQFSFAATKGASKDDTATRLAMGLNLTLWDKGDARMYHPHRGPEGDVLTCFDKTLQLPPPIPPLLPTATEAQRTAHAEMVRKINSDNEAANNKRADDCRKTVRKANWNRSSWIIAYAPSWISKTGQTSKFRWNGGALWTSLAYGFEQVPSLRNIGQLIFHARYRTREQVTDEKNPGTFLTQNSFLFGARFRAGSPKFGLNLEDIFVRNRPLGGRWDTSNRFSVGGELRLTDNVYFVLSAGGNRGRNDGKNKGFVMTSFKYGFNKKSQLNPQPAQ